LNGASTDYDVVQLSKMQGEDQHPTPFFSHRPAAAETATRVVVSLHDALASGWRLSFRGSMPDYYVDARSIHAAVVVTFFAVEGVPLRASSVLLFSFARLEVAHLAAVRILGHHGNKLEVNALRAVG
jgi:hypothetical protein